MQIRRAVVPPTRYLYCGSGDEDFASCDLCAFSKLQSLGAQSRVFCIRACQLCLSGHYEKGQHCIKSLLWLARYLYVILEDLGNNSKALQCLTITARKPMAMQLCVEQSQSGPAAAASPARRRSKESLGIAANYRPPVKHL